MAQNVIEKPYYEKKARTGWLLSYSDVVTLLITFFIMMISKQTGDISRMNAWVTEQLNRTAREIQEVIDSNQIENITVAHHSKGVQITLRGQSIFNTGEATPLPELTTQLQQISKAIANLSIFHLAESEHQVMLNELKKDKLKWNVEIRVEGHTDNVPLGSRSRFRDNWQLSAARAQTVMKMLQEMTGLPELIFAVAGFGEFQPSAPNDTEESRALNRRVEIYIDASIQQVR
jgi:chemotaxis protein MotB